MQSGLKPKKNEKSKVGSYTWIDEVELDWLKTSMKFKMSRAKKFDDWKSRQTKYGDILNLFIEQ